MLSQVREAKSTKPSNSALAKESAKSTFNVVSNSTADVKGQPSVQPLHSPLNSAYAGDTISNSHFSNSEDLPRVVRRNSMPQQQRLSLASMHGNLSFPPEILEDWSWAFDFTQVSQGRINNLPTCTANYRASQTSDDDL